MTAPRSQIAGKSAQLLLELDFQGLVLRFTTASQAVTVVDADGDSFEYAAGMDSAPVTTEAGAVFGAFGVSIPKGLVDWSLLRKRGHRFDLGSAVLRRWYSGQVLEQAEVIIRGLVTTPSWGSTFEPMRFGIERQLRRRGSIPGPAHSISADTWPVSVDTKVDPAVIGKDYQLIFGFPGRIDGEFSGPVSPAYIVEWKISATLNRESRAQISLGEIHASEVTLHNVSQQPPVEGSTTMTRPSSGGVTDLSQEGPWVRPVIDGFDLRGEAVSLIDWNDVTVSPPSLETQYRIAFDRVVAGVPQGGILNRERDAPLRGGGEIIRYLFEQWTDIPIDVGAMEAQRVILDAYKLDFVLGRRSRIWDFVRSNIASLLPVEWRESSEGGYFQAFKLDADRTEAEFTMVATRGAPGRNVTRTSPYQSTGKNVFNRITIHYAPGGQQQNQLRTVIIDAEYDPNDERVVPEFLARWSQSLYGVRDLVIDTRLVSDEATARLIGRDKLLQHAIPRHAFQVEGGVELNALDLNSVGVYTDEDANIVEELVIVRAKTVVDRTVSLDMLLLEDPTKRSVGTA